MIVMTILLTPTLAQAETLTPEKLVEVMTQGGPFRIPLTMPTFEAIRSMTEEQANQVRSHFESKKSNALAERKAFLEAELVKVNQEIANKPILEEIVNG